ncbi:hypothetical protein IQ06DRAFT_92332 [Phaeosphaeriaceae sp. SRC1lsM3a]|nr:hypothetical protein IQ06DRAFT_92332 [Stagonospora sp. SRC1lsM3a]
MSSVMARPVRIPGSLSFVPHPGHSLGARYLDSVSSKAISRSVTLCQPASISSFYGAQLQKSGIPNMSVLKESFRRCLPILKCIRSNKQFARYRTLIRHLHPGRFTKVFELANSLPKSLPVQQPYCCCRCSTNDRIGDAKSGVTTWSIWSCVRQSKSYSSLRWRFAAV